MSFGGVASRAFLDDMAFHRLWQSQVKYTGVDTTDESANESDDSNNDVRRLFPRKRLKPKQPVRRVNKISTGDPPEWLAVFVGVFFVAGVAGIASYQAYKLDNEKELKVKLHFNDIVHDAPIDLDIYNKIKLPKSLKPLSYILYINPNFTGNIYNGLVKITVECVTETSQLILHSASHKISKIELKSQNTSDGVFNIAETIRNRKRQMLILKSEKPFVVGHYYDVLIGFGNVLSYDLSNGIYLTNYKDSDDRSHTMVSTDFEPTQARHTFPCFDEPEFKATFKIILLHEDDSYEAISNMPVKMKVPYGSKSIETHFEETPLISTYLVVFAVTQYHHKTESIKDGITIKVYAPKGRTNDADIAATVAPLFVRFYEELFDLKYSLPKLDLIPLTSMSAAADETWGANIFEESYLLYDSSKGSVGQLEDVVSTIAHEFSHQWFGDLVTMKWWNDLWLKESFAAYLQYLPIQKFYPSWDLKTSFYSNNIDVALWFDASKYTHPIHTDIVDPEILRTTYDLITYQKGASVVAMLGNYLGHKTFLKGVNIYLKKYGYGNADADQFWDAISEAAPNLDVAAFMNPWVKQSGFPLISIENHKGELKVSQKYFIYKNIDGKNEFDEELIMWQVPITFKFSQNETKLQYSLTNRKDTLRNDLLSANPNITHWYKANYGAAGYYRVNYDEENWNNLLNVLNTEHTVLPAIDRANLLADINSLAIANYKKLGVALDFTKYLSKEHHYVPWDVGVTLLSKIRYMFYDTKLRGCVEEYMLGLVQPVLTYLDTQKEHDHIQKHLIARMLSYAVSFDDPPLVTELNNRFLKWVVSDSRTSIPSTIRSSVLKAGILYGEKYEWFYLLGYYQNVSSMQEQKLVLSVLASTKDKDLLKRFIELAANSTEIPVWQRDRVYMYVCANPYGRDIAWQQVKNDYVNIYERNKSDPLMLSYVLSSCLASGKSEQDLLEAEKFFKENNMEKIKVYADRILEKIQRNIDFMKREKEITDWFKKNQPQCLTSAA